jgi:2-oxo-4-hydroxy-4-carboxy-5-ureidoimidazoline decarboxylase
MPATSPGLTGAARVPEAVPLAAAAAMDRDAFVRQFGAVFEGAAWVAEEAWAARPFTGVEALHEAMVAVLLRAPRDRQLAVVHAHPDLAGSSALSASSAREQHAAGLGALTDADRAELLALNAAYRARFGFPFVICARVQTPATILAAARARVAADPAAEERSALAEVAKIARLRLAELVA